MTQVTIEFPQSLLKQVTFAVARSADFQIEDMSSLNKRQGAEFAAEALSQSAGFSSLESEIRQLLDQIGLGTGVSNEAEDIQVTQVEQIAENTAGLRAEISQVLNEIQETEKHLVELKQLQGLLTPFQGLDIAFESIRNRRYLFSVLGTMPADRLERFRESVARSPFVILELDKKAQRSSVLMLGPRSQSEYMLRVARSAYLDSVELPDDLKGTPAEILVSIRSETEDQQKKLTTLHQRLDDIRQRHGAQLQQVYWQVRLSRMLVEVITRYGKLKNDYLVVGWIPRSRQEAFGERLRAISPNVFVTFVPDTELGANESPPVKLNHQGPIASFQKLVTTYSVPGYNEIDPTVLMFITFPLLFGAMFGDVGQGALLALAGVFLHLNRGKALKRYQKIGAIIVLCGISAVVFGFLYGSIFGFEETIKPLWERPIDNITSILLVTFAAGAVLLSLANILSLINAAKQGRWGYFLFNGKGLAGLLLYWSFLGLIVGMAVPHLGLPTRLFTLTALITGTLVLFSGVLERLLERKRPLFESGLLIYIIQAFFEFFEVMIGFISNSLSYVRVGAFAVAHAGLSRVFMMLAEMVDPAAGAGYWIVIVIGNIFILGFEGMIVSIQTLRLEYYEFFSKFFRGGGRMFRPMRAMNTPKQGA